MNLRKRIISGGMLVGMSHVVAMAMSFVRNVIIARTVSLEDMGIAATIALALMIVESATDMSVNPLIVQAKDGDDPLLQSNAHSFLAARGCITAIILALAGAPLARLFNVPQAAWAFQAMAVAPLIRGFAHQDLWRFHRQMRFEPLASAELISQAVALAAAWPLAAWIGNYSVMLWVILIQVSVMTMISHIAKERPFRLAFDGDYTRRIFTFGWPLLLNGVLILILNYGDRAVIAAMPGYSMADVGLYMVANTVVLTPSLLIAKLAGTILLSPLSKSQDDKHRFESQFVTITTALGVAAVLQTAFLMISGPALTILLFGTKYTGVEAFFGWLSAAAGFRVLRFTPTLGAFALGDTKNTLFANIARSSGFLVAIVAGCLDADLNWFAIGAFLGELVAYIVAISLLAYRTKTHNSMSTIVAVLLLMTIGVSMGVFEAVRGPHVLWMIPVITAIVIGAAAICCGAYFCQTLRVELRRLVLRT